MKKTNLDTDCTPFTKVNSEWVIGLHVKFKTLKLPEDNIGENLHDLNITANFRYNITCTTQ